MKNRNLLTLTLVLLAITLLQTGCQQNQWISLFDGETMEGWKPSENKNSWKVENGALVTRGPRSHLFYVGDAAGHDFKNFEFQAEVKTEKCANSGIYFHTAYQEEGWPDKGYEAQVINATCPNEEGKYGERKMTGSLYAIRNNYKPPVDDGEWFTYRIVVKGKTIRTYINGHLIADYTEPDNPYRPEGKKGRVLSSGTFALQCHDPNSTVYYKNIKVKPLPDNLKSPGKPLESDYANRIIDISGTNIPVMDLHTHLKKGLTKEQALDHARKYGFTYGIAYNCGLKMGFESDDSLNTFLDNYEQPPQTYLAMQAEGREWLDLFSKETIDRFDYAFTDAMTWTNDQGQRMRLWIPEETFIGDPQDFMDQLVDRIVTIVTTEPIDIYVNATYIPKELQDRYDELWTDERIDKVVNALAEGKVALEISARYQWPSARIIKKAKEAGVKFTFGTNNGGPNDLGRLEYCLDMVEECKLKPNDFWVPHDMK